MKEKLLRKDVITLALLVAILPPAWAVASPYMGIHVGPIALITAGIYGANGNKFADAKKIALGYLAGDLWALISAWIMANFVLINADVTLFTALFVQGFLVVLISHALPNWLYMPSWLAGWAIGMLSMNLDTQTPRLRLAVEVGIAMVVGVYYVGALMDKIFRLWNKTNA